MTREWFPSNRSVFTLSVILFLSVCLAADDNRTYVTQFYQRFDGNSDGVLEPKEWQSSRSSEAIQRAIEDAGLNPNDKVSLKAVVDARLKGSKRSRDDDKDNGYRTRIGHERLDKDVPDWFRQRDKNLDSQVTMAEYASQWTDKLVDDFLELDLNRDGVITPEESLKGGGPADRSTLASNSSSPSRFGSRPEPGGRHTFGPRPPVGRQGSPGGDAENRDSSSPADTADAKPEDGTSSDDSESLAGFSETYIDYARGIIKKYDTDSSGFLTKNEWSQISQDPSGADTDGDQKITLVEYLRWVSSQ